jgi:predicted O-methyltransferase YrrM
MAKVRNPLAKTLDWFGPNRREVFLDHLVKTNGWTIGAEVGVRFGRVLFYLLDNNPNLVMYAIDQDITQFYNSAVAQKYQGRLQVLAGNSWDQAEKIPTKIDFVFIDASHSQKSVTRDINAYSNLLKTPKGLLGHDVDFPAIQKALADCRINFDVGPDNIWLQR